MLQVPLGRRHILFSMCLAKFNPQQSQWYVDSETTTEVEADTVDIEFAFETPNTIIVLDDIFKFHVIQSPTAEHCKEIDDQVQKIRALHLHQVLHIVPLGVSTRDFACGESQQNALDFWLSCEKPGNGHEKSDFWVSQYYQRSYWQEGLQTYTSEPCTGVVGNRVVLCIELYFNLSNVILYRDIMTSLDKTLQETLCCFNDVQKFEAHISYKYIQYCVQDGWYWKPLDQELLSMTFRDLLSQPCILNSNEVDFFRLSPAGVCESSVCGVLECIAN